MKRKMNGLYKTAFILMLVAAVLFVVATIVAYALERPYFSAVFCSGAFLAFLGIIFATCSKPKKRKRHLVTDEIVAENDDINKISENSVDNEE